MNGQLCLFSSTAMLSLMLVSILSRDAAALRVIGGDMTVAKGGTVVLPCKLIDSTEGLTQITWQRKTRRKPQNHNFYIIVRTDTPRFVNGYDGRFRFFGRSDDNDGSLQLSNVTLMDEGTYTCIFTLFPSGPHKTEIPLNVLVPPVASLQDHHPVLGDTEVSLVTCTAAGSKPPADVRWETDGLAGKVRSTTSFIQHNNGTTTTVSSLFGIPSREIYQQQVQCVVSNTALKTEETLLFTIQVYFPPRTVMFNDRGSGLFECVAEANPNADVTWSRPDDTWPHSAVRVEGATLQFLSMSSELNGIYKCEASNTYGAKHGHFTVFITSGTCTVCWALFGVFFILELAAAAAVWYCHHCQAHQTQNHPQMDPEIVSGLASSNGRVMSH